MFTMTRTQDLWIIILFGNVFKIFAATVEEKPEVYFLFGTQEFLGFRITNLDSNDENLNFSECIEFVKNEIPMIVSMQYLYN